MLEGRISMDKQTDDRKKFNWFIPIAVIIVLYFSSVLVSQQFYLNQMSRDQAAADARLKEAQKENEALRAEQQKLGDPEHIERIAREELGMTRSGEIPYSTVKKERK